METIRAFIAIELPSQVQKKLGEVINRLKRAPVESVRWVQPHNIHITLKFLGDVPINQIPILTQVLKDETLRHKPFEISIGGLGAFPNLRKPRVIWVGVEAPPGLARLQAGIETETRRILGTIVKRIAGSVLSKFCA